MAERYAVATGNWSDLATWDGGVSLPGSGDDVYSNNKTVTVDQNVTVLSIRNTAGTTAVAGGGFTCSTTRTINANVIAGAAACLTLSGTSVTCTHSGTVQGGTAANSHGITITSGTNALNHTSGTITAGSNASAHGINIAGMTVGMTVTGNVVGATGNGINATSGCTTLDVTGNVSTTGTGAGLSVGGTWTGSALCTVTGNVLATTGTGNGITATGNLNLVINGKVSAGQGPGMNVSHSGTLVVNNVGATALEGCTDAAGNGDHCITGSGAALTITINGNIVGATAGSSCYCMNISSTTQGITVNGDVTGGTNSNGYCINIAGSAITNGVTINGTAKGGTGLTAYALTCSSTQNVIVTTVKGNDYGNGTVSNPVPGINCTADNGNIRAKQILFGDYGMPPTIGRIRLIDDVPNNLVKCARYSDNVAISFRQTSYSADFPAIANVRNGTVYDNGAKTGTCYVPAASSVAYGVNVDATTGTAVLTQSNVRSALGMANPDLDTQLSTIDDFLDTEIAAIKAKTDALPADTNAALNSISAYIDTEVAAIKAKTDNLPSDPADASDIAAAFATVNGTLSTIAGYVDTEIAAIKTKTDNLPADTATVLSDLPKNVWNFDLLANIATTVNRYSPWNAMRHIINKWSISGATKTVYKEDGTTTAYTTTVTSDATGITGDTP